METLKGACILTQSGGPTAVINSSICGAAQEAFAHPEITGVFGAVNGILGVLNEDFIDMGMEPAEEIELLRRTPSSALGSCRHKLSAGDFDRVFDVFAAHNVRYFIVNGGNDSMDTADRVCRMAEERGYPLRVMGIPKTIDNDLAYTDHCPGYGSVSRWLAISVRDAGKDTEAIYTSDTIKIIETMGRNAGWITAATALARTHEDEAPHLIYLPETPFDEEKFLSDVAAVHARLGYAVITVCEGLKNKDGEYLASSGSKIDVDGFGHKQLGGVADILCRLIASQLKLKARFDKPGTIQRTSTELASAVDLEEAYAVGRAAVRQAVEGVSGKMVTLVRESNNPYRCVTGLADLKLVANAEHKMPPEFINAEGNWVTDAFLDYVRPLIGGELPRYARLKRNMVEKKL